MKLGQHKKELQAKTNQAQSPVPAEGHPGARPGRARRKSREAVRPAAKINIIMSLIKKPSELEAKNTISMLIYGQPGVGKSTLGCSAPNCVLFDYDGGVQRMNGAHKTLTVQIRSWEDTQAALDEIAQSYPDVETIVIDTVGKMLDYMSEYIVRNNPKMKKADGSLTLPGYWMRKQMFIEFIRKTGVLGKNVIFIAHEKEEKRGEEWVKRPEIGGSSANDLIKELDLVGYVSMIGKERTIAFNPTEWYYAKNTCNLDPVLKIPVVVDDKGVAIGSNDFIKNILDAYVANQQHNREMTEEYDRLIDAITTAVKSAATAEDMNGILDSIKETQIYNSLLIGRKMLAARAKEIKVTFNKISARYE